MNLLPLRNRRTGPGRHDRRHPASVPETVTTPEPEAGVDYDNSYDRNGWDEADPFPGYDADAEWQRARKDRPREQAHEPEPWWGLTEMDIPPAHDRRYVASPSPFAYRDLFSAQEDLGDLVIFRDTVRTVFVRQEEARGFRAPAVPWFERYAGLYRARTALPVVGEFGIADAARQAHEEAREVLAADVRERIDRITAPVEYGIEAAA